MDKHQTELRGARGAVAVVTDATSADYTFPLWHKYYGDQFGAENLYVLTYANIEHEFDGFVLGGVEQLAKPYNDDLRTQAVSDAVERLLGRYETVVRVDVDEFLVVDPEKHGGLGAYVRDADFQHVTARGFDIIQGPDDGPIDPDRGLLQQRRLAYALTAMNKTAVTRRPIRWGRGFHYGSAPPALGDIFLFHVKRVDLARQCDWARRMASAAPEGSFEAKYYADELTIAVNFVRDRWRRASLDGLNSLWRVDFNAKFSEAIRFDAHSGRFEGPYDIEEANVLIPSRFADLF